jgi:hypothetical protein
MCESDAWWEGKNSIIQKTWYACLARFMFHNIYRGSCILVMQIDLWSEPWGNHNNYQEETILGFSSLVWLLKVFIGRLYGY